VPGINAELQKIELKIIAVAVSSVTIVI